MLLQFTGLRYPLGVGGWIHHRNGIHRSQEKAKKRGAYPQSGARLGSLPSWLKPIVGLGPDFHLAINFLTQFPFRHF